ncbi:MAG: LytTR family transcriptional regulator [Flavipsychrobacter sp.]|nr:LytTR family transcriptional regulator [Flavipsychrobacter sp.]
MDSVVHYSTFNFLLKFRWQIGYTIVALSFIFIGQGNSLSQCLRIPSFYSDIAFAFATTFLTALYLEKLNKKLNITHPLDAVIQTRIGKQILLGILAPALVAMALEVLYLFVIGVSFADSSILNLELPLSILFLTLINALYLSLCLYRIGKSARIVLFDQAVEPTDISIDHIIAQSGARDVRIELANCAYLFSSSKVLWLQTFSGDRYRVKGTLEYWEDKLRHANFYRVNRQFLTVRNAIQSVEHTETRKLKVNFVVPPPGDVFISKSNSVHFRQWWENNSPS